MAKEKKVKEEKSEVKLGSKDILGAILKSNKDDHYNFHERVNWTASTGSLILDAATGKVKPSLWRVCGANNCGKTPQTLEIIRNIFLTVPNSKCLWFLSEGRGLSEENKKRCGLKFVYTHEEWDLHTVLVIESSIYELFIKMVKELVYNNPEKNVYAFVADSINGLILRSDSKKDIEENTLVCGQAALSKKMMQSLSVGMFKFGHFMALVSQVTSEVKIDPYAKTANRGGMFSGGNALLHASDVIVNYENSYTSDFILDNPAGKFNDGKSKAIGQDIRVTLIKSTLEQSKKTSFTYPVKFGKALSGIWVEREIGDLILSWEMGKRAGAWISFAPEFIADLKEQGIEWPEQIQGLNNLYKELEENTKAKEYLFNKFSKILGS